MLDEASHELKTWSPFAFKEERNLVPCNGQDSQGISPDRLSVLLMKEQLSECSELIIQFLHEFHYLTGNLIINCFLHPEINPSVRKFKKNSKNPYHRELQFLTHIGAVKQYNFIGEKGEREGSTIYTLTNGSRIWAAKRFARQSLFSWDGKGAALHHPESDTKITGYVQMLTQLSLNQFHIAMVIHHKCQIEICKKELEMAIPYNYYKSHGTKIYAISIREYWRQSSVESLFNLLDSDSKYRNAYIIIITESMNAAEQLFKKIICNCPSLSTKGTLLFIRDYSTKNAQNPLIDELAHFIDNDWTSFDICSLEMANNPPLRF